MGVKSSLSLFLRRAAKNERLRFVFFMETNPKHRVSDGIPTIALMALSIVTFLCGLSAFAIIPIVGFFGMLGYMGLVIVTTLEVFHFVYDR